MVNQGGTNAQYKGSGTINGDLAPTGEAYKFMLWAKDLRPDSDDTFRIKIWYEEDNGIFLDAVDDKMETLVDAAELHRPDRPRFARPLRSSGER